MEMTGGEALVAQLVAEGVTDVFGIPGVQLDWATDALRRAQDRIRYWVPRHEQTASYMADGYARTTGKLGVCMVVPGPGLLNATAGLATAYSANSPVLCIAGQILSSAIGKRRGLLHELDDQSAILAVVTKWSRRAEHAADIPALVREAVRQIRAGRPRPAGIEISPDLLAGRAEMAPLAPPDDDGRLRPDAPEIDAAAALLDGARFPVIYAGGGVLAAGATRELQALAERLDAPVVLSENGRGALSDRHPLSLDPVGGRAVFAHADVALVVGSRFAHTSTGQPMWPAGSGIRWIYLNAEPADWTPPRQAGTTIHADAQLGLAALTAVVRRRSPARAGDVSRVRAWVADQIAALEPQMSWLRALRTAIPDDGILVNELTQVGYVARAHYPVYVPNTFINPGYQGTLGYGFPTALGAAVGNPTRAVVSITGDGGFGWGMAELATAARYALNVVVVVFNDGHFGNVRTLQRDQFGAAYGDELRNPRYDLLAAAFGVRYARVDGPSALGPALTAALGAGGPTLIEAPVGAMPSPWHLMRLTPPPAKFAASAPPNPLGAPPGG